MTDPARDVPALRCRCCGQVLDITSDLQFLKDGRTVIIRRREYVLRWQEHRALQVLASTFGTSVSCGGIAAGLYGGQDTAAQEGIVRVYIHRLRTAIAGCGLIIRSDHAGGYYLEWK